MPPANTFWFDLDNSPHVPLFRPILTELDKQQKPYLVTARDFAQTRDLLQYWGIRHTLVGTHGGKSKVRKMLNLIQRSNQLVKEASGKNITLAVSHGSRSQLVAAKRLRIPSVLMLDYEYTETTIFNALASVILMPTLIPDDRLAEAGFRLKKVIRFDGFKEEVYLQDFVPDEKFRAALGIDKDAILVTMRPPSMTGNYHDERSEKLFTRAVDRFSSVPGCYCLIVGRTNIESRLFKHSKNVHTLDRAVDGLQLLWSSDLVLSGGGTMNREAALLGIPTFSIFSGRRPYLDEYLQGERRLTFIETASQIESINVERRPPAARFKSRPQSLAAQITNILSDISSPLARKS